MKHQNYYKYPRTYHVPWSNCEDESDKVLKSTRHFSGKQIIVTEKMDGENTSLYKDHIHARSIDSAYHWSRTWVKDFWKNFAHQIPDGYRLCGENMFAVHSIIYTSLPSYFLLFSVWNEEVCLSWEDTKQFVKELENVSIEFVPVLYEGEYSQKILKELAEQIDDKKSEGYVVRLADSFTYDQFDKSVAKYVRENHVQTDSHWMRTGKEMNMLKVRKSSTQKREEDL